MAIVVACVLACPAARADDPRVLPADHKEFSPNHAFFLEAKVKEKRTRVFHSGKVPRLLWEVPAYLEIADLSNDGKHLASSYAGGNILDPGVRPNDALVTFYNADGTSRAVSVAAVLPNFAQLPRSTSGQPWGRVIGFQPSGQLLVYLNDGRKLLLDPNTGRIQQGRQ